MEFENQVLLGNCLVVLRRLPSDTFDSIVTDPPYGLGDAPTVEEIIAYLQGADLVTGDFMGKDWQIPSVLVWREVFRVLKPGGHVLCFGGTRTWDLISMGLRAAGFENRDSIARQFPALQYMHGQGFPKSMNIGKAIDAKLGAEREVVGRREDGRYKYDFSEQARQAQGSVAHEHSKGWVGDPALITAPATEEASEWEGWGTALKPAWEPILVFRKPFKGTVAGNILTYGTGGLNIDATRVRHSSPEDFANHKAMVDALKAKGGSLGNSWKNSSDLSGASEVKEGGRWPTNVVMNHADGCQLVETGEEVSTSWQCVEGCPVRAVDEQSGAARFFPQFEGQKEVEVPFFYTGKASKREASIDGAIHNDHPTKKAVALMRWLIKLVTPKGGLTLDPYCGSGSTLHAAIEERVNFTGIELDPHFHEISVKRTELVRENHHDKHGGEDLFALMMEMSDDEMAEMMKASEG